MVMLVQKTCQYSKKQKNSTGLIVRTFCTDIHVLQWINPDDFSDLMTFLQVSRQIRFSVCSKLLFMTNKPHGVPASAELVKKYMIAC